MASLAIPMGERPARAAAEPPRPAAAPASAVEQRLPEVSGGFAAGGQNWTAIGVIGGLHAAAIALLLTTGAIQIAASPPPVHISFVEEIVQPQDTPPPAPELEPVPTEVYVPDVIVEAAPPPPPTITVTEVKAPKVVAAPTVKVSNDAPVIPPDFTADQLNNPGPRYPSASRRAREEGTVMLKVLVSPDGRAQELLVATSSGFGRLDEAAMATVKRWAFLPAKKAGKAVSAWVLVPVTFAIGPGEGGHRRGGGRGDRDDHRRGDHGPRGGPDADGPGDAPEPTAT